jgi:hypothetical protein
MQFVLGLSGHCLDNSNKQLAQHAQLPVMMLTVHPPVKLLRLQLHLLPGTARCSSDVLVQIREASAICSRGSAHTDRQPA